MGSMGNPVHEWVENFDEYEAVFLCTNPLGPWDTDVAVRAFQTFGWDDATMPGTDMTFAHALSAVMIKYDGNVLAINFGNGHLSEALPDLFAAITGLGWETAEVFHRPESMSALLKDIGAAIPANMAFDVVPAKSVIEISSFAEAESLVNRGRAMLQKGDINTGSGAIMLEELESMTPLAPESAPMLGQPFMGTSATKKVGIVLDDIDDHIDDHTQEIPALVHPSVQQTVKAALPVERVVRVPLVDEIRPDSPVPPERLAPVAPYVSAVQPVAKPMTVVALNDLVEAHAKAQATLVIENEHLRDALSIADERLAEEKESVRRLVEEQEQQAAQARASWLEPELPTAVAQAVAVDMFEGVSADAPSVFEGAIHVGASTFCFDLPDAPVSNDDVTRMTDQLLATHMNQRLNVVHVHPGAINEALRWDVFGELPSEYPWAAQKLAAAMGFTGDHCSLVASVLIELKVATTFAQLRDVLAMCAPDGLDSRSSLDRILGEGSSLAKRRLFARLLPIELAQVLDGIVSRLGGLLLCPEGSAFVDVRCSGDELAPEMQEMFTMRDLAQSPLARLFVIHVDALDGPFVTWLVDLLKAVALSYSMTGRYSMAAEFETEMTIEPAVLEVVPLVPPVPIEAETEIEQRTAARQHFAEVATQMSEMTVVVNDLVAKLRNVANMV